MLSGFCQVLAVRCVYLLFKNFDKIIQSMSFKNEFKQKIMKSLQELSDNLLDLKSLHQQSNNLYIISHSTPVGIVKEAQYHYKHQSIVVAQKIVKQQVHYR